MLLFLFVMLIIRFCSTMMQISPPPSPQRHPKWLNTLNMLTSHKIALQSSTGEKQNFHSMKKRWGFNWGKKSLQVSICWQVWHFNGLRFSKLCHSAINFQGARIFWVFSGGMNATETRWQRVCHQKTMETSKKMLHTTVWQRKCHMDAFLYWSSIFSWGFRLCFSLSVSQSVNLSRAWWC